MSVSDYICGFLWFYVGLYVSAFVCVYVSECARVVSVFSFPKSGEYFLYLECTCFPVYSCSLAVINIATGKVLAITIAVSVYICHCVSVKLCAFDVCVYLCFCVWMCVRELLQFRNNIYHDKWMRLRLTRYWTLITFIYFCCFILKERFLLENAMNQIIKKRIIKVLRLSWIITVLFYRSLH